MPPRIATGAAGDPDRLKALIVARPAIVEERLRVLDVDLGAGASGPIDMVCVDGSGSLTLLRVARGDPDAALLRLLDQRLWVADQIDLLRRLYTGSGMAPDRPVRCLLLAPAFTHAFVRRLSLLRARVTPLLVRDLPRRDESSVLIESAAALFGLEEPSAPVVDLEDDAASRPDAGEAGSGAARPVEPVIDWPVEVTGDLPIEVVAEVHPDAGLGHDRSPDTLFEEEGEPADPFETLTAEELAEFERFEAHRKERGRNP